MAGCKTDSLSLFFKNDIFFKIVLFGYMRIIA